MSSPPDYLTFDLSDASQAGEALSRFRIRSLSQGANNCVVVHPDAAPIDAFFNIGGDNNRIVLGPRCAFWGEVTCQGSDSTVTIRGDNHAMNLRVTTYTSSHVDVAPGVVAYGVRVWVGSGTSLSIGAGCQFSEGVTIRTTDHHAIFDMDTLASLNPPESVEIEPCVWIGQDVTVMKGVAIGAGSIVGARSLVNRSIPRTELWAGSPARMLRRGVSWADPHPASPEQLSARREQIAQLGRPQS